MTCSSAPGDAVVPPACAPTFAPACVGPRDGTDPRHDACILREFAPADAPAVHALLADARIAVPYFGGVLAPPELDRRVGAHWGHEPPPLGRRIVACAGKDGAVVGAAHRRGAELAWFVAPAWWRHGVATALVQRLCLDPEAAFAWVRRDNAACARLVEKLGFRFAGLEPPANASFGARARLRYLRPTATG